MQKNQNKTIQSHFPVKKYTDYPIMTRTTFVENFPGMILKLNI